MSTKVKVGGKSVKVGQAWYDSPWKIAGTAVSIVLGVLFIAAIIFLFVIPRLNNGATLTVRSPSMRPTFAEGDVIVIRGINPEDVCRDIHVGHIVTFQPEAGNTDLITHRVISKSAGTFPDGTRCRFTMQGDNNNAPALYDRDVSPEQIHGVFMYGIPRLGWAREWVSNQPQIILIVAAAAVGTYIIWSWVRPAKKTARVVVGPEAEAMRAKQALAAGAGGGGGDPTQAAIQQALAQQGISGANVMIPAGVTLGGGAPAAGHGAADPVAAAMEQEMRQREMALRERWIAVREAELGIQPTEPEPVAAPIAESAPVEPAAPETPVSPIVQPVAEAAGIAEVAGLPPVFPPVAQEVSSTQDAAPGFAAQPAAAAPVSVTEAYAAAREWSPSAGHDVDRLFDQFGLGDYASFDPDAPLATPAQRPEAPQRRSAMPPQEAPRAFQDATAGMYDAAQAGTGQVEADQLGAGQFGAPQFGTGEFATGQFDPAAPYAEAPAVPSEEVQGSDEAGADPLASFFRLSAQQAQADAAAGRPEPTSYSGEPGWTYEP